MPNELRFMLQSCRKVIKFKKHNYCFISLIILLLIGCDSGHNNNNLPPPTPPVPPNPPTFELNEQAQKALDMLQKVESGELQPLTEEEYAKTDYAKNLAARDQEEHARVDIAHRLAMGAIDPDPAWFSTHVDQNLIVGQPGTQQTFKLEKWDVDGRSLGPVNHKQLRVVVRLQWSDEDIETVPDAYATQYASIDEQGQLTVNVPNNMQRGRMMIGVRPRFADPGVRALTERWSVPVSVEVWPLKNGVAELKKADVIFPTTTSTDFTLQNSSFSQQEIGAKLQEHMQKNNELLIPIIVKNNPHQTGDLVSYPIDAEIIAGRVREAISRDNQQVLLIASEWFEVYDIPAFGDTNLMVAHGVMPEIVIYREGEAVPEMSEALLSDTRFIGPEERANIQQENELIRQSAAFTRTQPRSVLSFFNTTCKSIPASLTFGFKIDIVKPDIDVSMMLQGPSGAECKWTVAKKPSSGIFDMLSNGSVVGIVAKIFGTKVEIYPEGEVALKISEKAPPLGAKIGIGYQKGTYSEILLGALNESSDLNSSPIAAEMTLGGEIAMKAELHLVSNTGWVSRLINWFWTEPPGLSIYAKVGGGLGGAVYANNAAAVYQSKKDSRVALFFEVFAQAGLSEGVRVVFGWLNIITKIETEKLSYKPELVLTGKFQTTDLKDNGEGSASLRVKPAFIWNAGDFNSFIAPNNKQSSVFNDNGNSISYDIEECENSPNKMITTPVIVCGSRFICGYANNKIDLCGGELEVSGISARANVGSTATSSRNTVKLSKKSNTTDEPKIVSLSSDKFKISPTSVTLQQGESKNFTATAQCSEEGIFRGTVTATSGSLVHEAEAMLECRDDCKEGDCDRVWASPHLITADGMAYDYYASGDYILTKVPGISGIEVQGRFVPGFDVSWPVATAMRVGDDIVEIQAEYDPVYNGYGKEHFLSVYVNGNKVLENWSPLQYSRTVKLDDGGAIYVNRFVGIKEHTAEGNAKGIQPTELTILWPDINEVKGYSVTITGHNERALDRYDDPRPKMIQIKVNRPTAHKGMARGLLGDHDGNPDNDFIRRNGQVVAQNSVLEWSALYGLFGSDWLVRPGECLFRNGCIEPQFPPGAITLDPEARQQGEIACAALTGLYKEACIHDVGLTGSAELVEDYYANAEDLNKIAEQIKTPNIGTSDYQLHNKGKQPTNDNPDIYQLDFDVTTASGIGKYLLMVLPPQGSTARLLPNRDSSLAGSGDMSGGVEVLCNVPDQELAEINDFLLPTGYIQLWSVSALTGGAHTLQGEITLSCERKTALAAGVQTTFVLDEQGKLYSWGKNDLGQLATGDTNNKLIPSAVSFQGKIRELKTVENHTLAIDNLGVLWSWGENNSGQLGVEGIASSTVPVKVNLPAAVKSVAKIAAGSAHSLALDDEGQLWAWGSNLNGALGSDNALNNQTGTPQKVVFPAGVQVVNIAANNEFSLALDDQGQLWSWGLNSDGQLGLGNTDNRVAPEKVNFPVKINVINFALGKAHVLVADNYGQVWAWGSNQAKQLGLSNAVTSPQKVTFPEVVEINAVYCGEASSYARDKLGQVWVWGANNYGQLGMGSSNNNIAQPVKMDLSPLDYVAVKNMVAGKEHALLLDNQNRIFVWGNKESGAIGNDNNYHDTLNPLLVTTMGNSIAILDEGNTNFQTLVDVISGNTNNFGSLVINAVLNLPQSAITISAEQPGIYFEQSGIKPNFVTDKSGFSSVNLVLKSREVCTISGKQVLPVKLYDNYNNLLVSETIDIICPVAVDIFVTKEGNGNGAISVKNSNNQKYSYLFTGADGVQINGQQSLSGELCQYCATDLSTNGSCNTASPSFTQDLITLGNVEIYNEANELVMKKQLYCPLTAKPQSISVSKDRYGRTKRFVLYIDKANKVWSWGENNQLQLGHDLDVMQPNRVSLPDTLTFNHVSAYGTYSMTVDAKGKLWGWGFEHEKIAQKDPDNDSSSGTPKNIIFAKPDAPKLVAVTAVEKYALMLDVEGNVWRTYGDYDDATTESAVKIEFPDKAGKIIAISTDNYGFDHALDEYGQVWAWSDGYSDSLEQRVFRNTSAIIDISIKPSINAFVDDLGRIWMNVIDYPCEKFGECIDGYTLVPLPEGAAPMVAISVGNYFAIALDKQGQLWGIGSNWLGELGINDNASEEKTVLAKIQFPLEAGEVKVEAFAAGESNTFARDTQGRLWGWGAGELLDQTTNQFSPKQIDLITN